MYKPNFENFPTGKNRLKPGARICFVIGSLDLGGTEKHLVRTALPLAQRGFEVTICCLANSGVQAPQLERQGIKILAPPLEGGAFGRTRVGRCVRIVIGIAQILGHFLFRRPCIAHFFLPHAYLAGAPAAILARIPYTVMSRRSMNHYQGKYPRLSIFERYLHKSMSVILGNSKRVVKQLIEEEGAPANRVALIYGGIDSTSFDEFRDGEACQIVQRKLNLTPEDLVLIIVANLIPYKGHADLITALSGIKDHLPEKWRLLVVGRDDGIGETLSLQIKAAGLDQNVLLLGSRNDVPELLCAADIGLLASHEEGFSNALLEGMAAGLPLVVTDVGGNAEAIHDGVHGFVIPPKDPAAIGEAVLRLAGDVALRKKMGDAAQERVQQYFSMDVCVDSYEKLYRALLAAECDPVQASGLGID